MAVSGRTKKAKAVAAEYFRKKQLTSAMLSTKYLDQIQQYITLQQQHFCTRPHKKLKKVDKSFCNKLKFIIFVVKFNPKY